jgi:hypothetical protein
VILGTGEAAGKLTGLAGRYIFGGTGGVESREIDRLLLNLDDESTNNLVNSIVVMPCVLRIWAIMWCRTVFCKVSYRHVSIQSWHVDNYLL